MYKDIQRQLENINFIESFFNYLRIFLISSAMRKSYQINREKPWSEITTNLYIKQSGFKSLGVSEKNILNKMKVAFLKTKICLRIDFYLLRTFFLILVDFFFCVVCFFTMFRPNFTSGLLQVIYSVPDSDSGRPDKDL